MVIAPGIMLAHARSEEGALAVGISMITLAFPMFIAQIAQIGTAFVDTVMAGHLGESDLAAVAIGANIFMTVYITLLGVASALNPILSQLYGAKEYKKLGYTAQQGLWFCLGLGIIGSIILLLLIIPLQTYLKLSDYTRQTTSLFIVGVSLAMPAAMMHRALHAYASSVNKSTPIMVVSLIALLLIIPFNYVLMHGLFGLPKLGGAGCGFGTALSFWFNFLALFFYIHKSDYFKPFSITQKLIKPTIKKVKEFLHLGIPIGLSFFLETSLFNFIALLVVELGEAYVATQQVVMNITAMVYMVPQTIAIALSVRVGQAIGKGNYTLARQVSGVGISMGMVLALGTAMIMLLLRPQLISIYTNEPQIIAMGTLLLVYSAFFQVSDATQTIASGALRGYKLTKVAMVIHGISFWVFGLGLGYYLAFPQKMGLPGFWWGLIVSLTIAAILLTWYLLNRSKAFLVRDTFYAHLEKL